MRERPTKIIGIGFYELEVHSLYIALNSPQVKTRGPTVREASHNEYNYLHSFDFLWQHPSVSTPGTSQEIRQRENISFPPLPDWGQSVPPNFPPAQKF